MSLRVENTHWFIWSAAVFALDQLSKLAVIQWLILKPLLVLTPWLNLRLSFNSGAAFSMLILVNGWQRWILSAFSLVIAVVLGMWLMELEEGYKWLKWGLALVVGGALSNMVDRLARGQVIDFIDFHIHDWHYATFNLADSAITVGAIIIAIHIVFKKV